MRLVSAASIGIALFAAIPASGSIYSDDLAKCLVAKTSDQDKVKLIQWVFSALSASPEVEKLAKITPQQRDGYDRVTATMFDRLLTTDCRIQSVAALKYDGYGSFKDAFGVLGQVAMKSLTDQPAVDESFGRFTKYMDEDRLTALGAEAGVNTPLSVKPKK